MTSNIWKVYLHTNLINNKKYVGITSQSLASRWGHDGYNYRAQPKFYNAIKKYGWSNFSHEILYQDLTKERALELESQLINEYNSINNGYNCSLYGGDIYSKEVICSETNEHFPSVAAAARQYSKDATILSKHLHGKLPSAYGLHWYFVNEELNKEHYEADYLAVMKKNKKFEDDMKLVSLYLDGLTIRQISDNTGYSREKISLALKRQNIVFRNNYTTAIALDKDTLMPIKKFNTLHEACSWCGLNPDTESGRIKTAILDSWRICKGYKWTTEDDDYLIERAKREKEYIINNPPIDSIIEDYKNGLTTQKLSDKYNLCRTTISKILKEHGIILPSGGKQPIVQVDKETGKIIKIFDSIKDAYVSLGLNPKNPTLSKRCKDNKEYYGYIWYYLNEYNSKEAI